MIIDEYRHDFFHHELTSHQQFGCRSEYLRSMTTIKFNVTACTGVSAFHECMMFCYYGLKSLGYETTLLKSLDPEAINILFGAHESNWHSLSAQAPHIIIYNWEQVSPEVQWFNLAYFRQLLNTQVWDYNTKNISALQKAGVYHIEHVPLGYCPEMSEIPLPTRLIDHTLQPTESQPEAVEQDIDVLFYGSISPRRKQTLDAIRARGLKVVSTETKQVSGKERADLIARAKVVLNIHYYETVGIFEIVRVSYLLANHKAVVSELSLQTDIEPDIKEAIVSGSLDELPELCWQLVHDDARRAALERKGFEIFSKRNAAAILKPVVDKYITNLNSKPAAPIFPPPPKLLNIGAGSNWRFDAVNIDKREDFSPDIMLDLNFPIPFDQSLPSWRFGPTSLTHGSFTKIIANNVFQCSNDFVQMLTNCLDLLEEGGVLELEVPYDLSYGAWSIANTQRTFNERTWEKLLENWWQYGWETHRFECFNQSFLIVNSYGFEVLDANNQDWGAALKIPRAIDAIRVFLRKRRLTADEFRRLPKTKFLS